MLRLLKVLIALLLVAAPALAVTTFTHLGVSAMGPTSVTITFTTSGSISAQVNWGVGNVINSTNPDSAGTTHTFTIPALAPGNIYSYQAQASDGSTSATQNFALCDSGTNQVSLQGKINNYYAYGTYTLTFTDTNSVGGKPKICGAAITTPQSGSLDYLGSLTANVPDSLKTVPSPSTWAVAVADVGSIGTFTVQATVTSGSSDVSSALQTAANGLLQFVWYNPTSTTFYPAISGSGNVSNSGTPAAHQVPIWVTSSTIKGITPSTSGFVLTSNGTGSDPSFQASGGAVSSVFTRTGPVVAASGDYTVAQITNGLANNGAAMSGTYTGTPTFSGAVVFSGNPNFTGSPVFGSLAGIGLFTAGVSSAIAASGTKCYPFQGSGGTGCDTPGSSGITTQTNGTNNTSQTTLNLQNSAAFNGLTATFTNGSAGNVQAGFSGTLGNAGLTNSSTTVNGQTCTLGSSCTISAGGNHNIDLMAGAAQLTAGCSINNSFLTNTAPTCLFQAGSATVPQQAFPQFTVAGTLGTTVTNGTALYIGPKTVPSDYVTNANIVLHFGAANPSDSTGGHTETFSVQYAVAHAPAAAQPSFTGTISTSTITVAGTVNNTATGTATISAPTLQAGDQVWFVVYLSAKTATDNPYLTQLYMSY